MHVKAVTGYGHAERRRWRMYRAAGTPPGHPLHRTPRTPSPIALCHPGHGGFARRGPWPPFEPRCLDGARRGAPVIGRLAGRIARKAPQTVLLDVRGVAYQVTIPLSTFYTLAGEGEDAVLEISTQVREDAITLFGFATAREKVLFEQLISVSKVGPKLAPLSLGIAADDLCTAIAAGNVARLPRSRGSV
jgi:hypothetical protein